MNPLTHMKKLLSITSLKTMARGLCAINGTILFGLCAMQFVLQAPAPQAQGDATDTSCSPTPTVTPTCSTTASPTPMPSVSRTPDQTKCTPSPTPYPASVELIPQAFQSPHPKHAHLAWLPFTPSPAPTATPPAVMVIHGGNWNAQAGDSPHVVEAAQDIADQGYFVVSVWYELAPPGYIRGQPCHSDYPSPTPPGARMKQEVDDIKALVRALRADPRCNGKVGVVGGSAGATHAVTVALDKTRSGGTWPNWCDNPPFDDRPDCAVMLSAIYDFSDWTPPTGESETDIGFRKLGLENYAQTLDLNTLATLPLNPVVLVSEAGQQNWGFKPFFLINSYCDAPTAYHQIVTMSCALEAQRLVEGIDYKSLTIPGDNHAFGYWNAVKRDVIDFLDCHLKDDCH